MLPTHRILNSELLPVALQMPDGSYLPSADQALGLWDKIRVILLDSTLDPRHTHIWGLFVFRDGKPFKYLAVSDDYHSLGGIQEDLVAISLDDLMMKEGRERASLPSQLSSILPF